MARPSRQERHRGTPSRRLSAVENEIDLKIAGLLAIPLAGQLDWNLPIEQGVNGWIAAPLQKEPLTFAGQKTVNGFRGDFLELGGSLVAAVEFFQLPRMVNLGPEDRSEPLSAWVIEDGPTPPSPLDRRSASDAGAWDEEARLPVRAGRSNIAEPDVYAFRLHSTAAFSQI
jgi:hypothetical protein